MIDIYYVEDDGDIARAVKNFLSKKNNNVTLLPTIAEAKCALKKHVPAIVLNDWNMPDGRGDAFCRWIRLHWKDLPVLFLTVRDDSHDIVLGFQNGADDYIVKPFDLEVLYSRILAVLRRAGDVSKDYLSCHGISIDCKRTMAFVDSEEISLSPSEYQLLLYLMRNKGKTISREALILTDMPRIVELAGFPKEAVSYHYSLLNMYFIRDSNDTALRWVFPFAFIITAIACLSLVLVIHNAFAVTMNARIHQFGIFSSIGATPGQIRACLLQEAFALCAAPILAGNLLGILLCAGIIQGINMLLADVANRLALPFDYHPFILLFSLFISVLTIWVSAWIPARRMSKLTPLEAIKNASELKLKKKSSSRILSFLFGMEGELAGNALKAQRKAMRTATLSLVFSFLAFAFMMCFFTIVFFFVVPFATLNVLSFVFLKKGAYSLPCQYRDPVPLSPRSGGFSGISEK